MVKYLRYLHYLSPIFCVRQIASRKLEKEQWGNLEQEGIDFLKMGDKGKKGCSRYQITRPQHLSFIADFLKKQGITKADAVIDVGCGKGGLLEFYSRFGFGLVAGLEYEAELCEICKNNIEKLHVDAMVIHGDANVYDDYDMFNYFYLYNPFDESITKNFIENVKKSINRRPRNVWVIYTNPIYLKNFEVSGYRVLKKYKGNFILTDDAVIMILENKI